MAEASVTVPAWARSIGVKCGPMTLFVRGRDRVPDLAVLGAELSSPAEDLLSQYVPGLRWAEKRGTPPPHIQFANANTHKLQVDFVRRFGPVWGSVKRDGSEIEVEQSLDVLRREQRTFRLAARIMLALREPSSQRYRLFEPVMLLAIENETVRSSLEEPALDSMMNKMSIKDGIPESIVLSAEEIHTPHPYEDAMFRLFHTYRAHWALGRLLERFPPALVFFNGRAAELPRHSPEGILPMLYYMLRRDYLDQQGRTIACANVRCQKFFAIEREGQRFCSEECSKLQRQRDYWRSRGSNKRRERNRKRATSANVAS